MSKEQNFTIHAGEDKTLHVTIYKADDVTLEDTNGWTYEATFRPEVEGSAPILAKAGINVGPAEADVPLTRAETLPWAAYDRLVFALRRTNAGASTVVVDGVVTIDDP